MTKNFSKPFLIALVLITFVACYFVFQPFLTEIVVAAILVTIFYKPYEKLVAFLKGRKNIAALLMCLFLVAILILPTVKLITYAAEKSVIAYTETSNYFNTHDFSDIMNNPLIQKLNLGNLPLNNNVVKDALLDFLQKSSNWMISGATSAVVSTTNFIVSLVMIILTMFFFFVDGPNMLRRIMYLSPLPDKYDKEIFNKFKEVSYTTMVSTFVVALIQGLVGAIGFAIVGFPAFLAGVLIALLSLFPYLGSMIFYVPMGVYYLLAGQTWQGIFVLAWGFLIIGSIDNIIRAWMLKDKAQINPIFVVFSVLGGIVLFGFWGVVLGPLIVSVAATILHIYALEFCEELDSPKGEEGTLLQPNTNFKKIASKNKKTKK